MINLKKKLFCLALCVLTWFFIVYETLGIVSHQPKEQSETARNMADKNARKIEIHPVHEKKKKNMISNIKETQPNVGEAQLDMNKTQPRATEVQQLLRTDPKYDHYLVLKRMEILRESWMPIIGALGVDKNTANKILSLIAEKEGLGTDIETAMKNEKIPASESAKDAGLIADEFNKKIDDEVHDLIGEDKYQKLQNLIYIMPCEGYTDRISNFLACSSMQLTNDQRDAMIMATATAKKDNGVAPLPFIAVLDAVLALPEGILNEEQIQRIEVLKEEENKSNNLKKLLKQK